MKEGRIVKRLFFLLLLLVAFDLTIAGFEGCVNSEQCRDFCEEGPEEPLSIYCCWTGETTVCCCEYEGVEEGCSSQFESCW